MRTRSHGKAFRNALLWTWWFPLLLAAVAGGLRYSFDKDQPDEWIALGKISLTLPGGQAPDNATIEEHIALLESFSMAERAKTQVMEMYPELRLFNLPEGNIKVTRASGGVLHATAMGPDGRGTEAFLNEGMSAYLTMAEIMRRDPAPAGAKLNQLAIPSILELAGPALKKPRELLLPAGLTAAGGGMAGLPITLLICSLWAFFRPAGTQPSLNEIMKAAAGLDPMARSVLAEWLKTQERG